MQRMRVSHVCCHLGSCTASNNHNLARSQLCQSLYHIGEDPLVHPLGCLLKERCELVNINLHVHQ